MARKKLDSVQRVYEEQVKSLTRELQQLREQRAQQMAQAEELRVMLSHYRSVHHERSAQSAAQVAQVSRFYQRIAEALDVQSRQVARTDLAYQGKQDQWRKAYRQRRAIDLVLTREASEEALHLRRRERRGTPRRGGADAWSMLNDEP
ncbi:MAG: flagellar FliJ family protein [Pseudomonadales bacterium]